MSIISISTTYILSHQEIYGVSVRKARTTRLSHKISTSSTFFVVTRHKFWLVKLRDQDMIEDKNITHFSYLPKTFFHCQCVYHFFILVLCLETSFTSLCRSLFGGYTYPEQTPQNTSSSKFPLSHSIQT